MAHIGQEGAFGFVGQLRLFARRLRRLEQLCVADGRAHLGHVALNRFDVALTEREWRFAGGETDTTNGSVLDLQRTEQDGGKGILFHDQAIIGPSLCKTLRGYSAHENRLAADHRSCCRTVVDIKRLALFHKALVQRPRKRSAGL